MYRGFLEQVGLSQIARILQVPNEKLILWPVYTDYDIAEERKSIPKSGIYVCLIFPLECKIIIIFQYETLILLFGFCRTQEDLQKTYGRQ